MFKLLPLLVFALLSFHLSAEPNIKGFEPSSVQARLRFDFKFQKIEAYRNPLYHFLSSASIGTVSIYHDATKCTTSGSLHNVTTAANGDLVGNVFLSQEGHCRLPQETDDQLREKLIAVYLNYFSGIEGLTVKVLN
jgi:hypothetical protein